MFGYIRAYKPYMRIFEYDIYKAVYCGLCKDMGRRYGFVPRLTLSFDFTFLALCGLSVSDSRLKAEPQRCIAHPLRKRVCATCQNNFGYYSAAAVILTYHKLRDDLADKGAVGKLTAAAALPFFSKPYKKACRLCPELAPKIQSAMRLQSTVEKDKSAGVDYACEPTAQMMRAVFSLLSADTEKSELLGRFGYLLGRFIYLCDALDDLEKDFKDGNFNPLLNRFDVTDGEKISPQTLEEIRCFTDDSVNFTLGELAEVYVKTDFKRYRDILDNIIYMGLRNVYSQVRCGEFRKKKKHRKGTFR